MSRSTTFIPNALLLSGAALLILTAASCQQQPPPQSPPTTQAAVEPTKLAVLWTSGDPMVAHRVGLMYAHGAKTRGWFEEVKLIVWGPSANLLSTDEELQAKVRQMHEDGVVVEACIACASAYGVVEELRALEITVHPMGQPLTEMLKSPQWRVITF